jgi:hypothetical protein
VIALIGLAAQTGVVMIVYIDQAFERRKRAGLIRNLDDIIAAHMEGSVLRVRPKLMTVGSMLAGLVPLLWATGSGADVMKRIAVPMVGGLLSSAFLTLEIIPVISTYFRYEQLLWQRLSVLDPRAVRALRSAATALGLGLTALGLALVSPIYVALPQSLLHALYLASGAGSVGGLAAYLVRRPAAKQLVWPAPQRTAADREPA